MGNRIVVTRRCLEVTKGHVDRPGGVEPRTISLDEWLAHVARDPALVPVRLAANEDDALRAARPVRLSDRSTDRWLYWAAGEIRANGPDPALLGAMMAIARALGARVGMDDEEHVLDADRLFPERPPRAATPHPRAIAPRGDGTDAAGRRFLPGERARVERVSPGRGRLGRSVTGRTGVRRAGDDRSGERRPIGPDPLEEERARADRRAAQAMLVAGTLTVVCAASVVWMVRA